MNFKFGGKRQIILSSRNVSSERAVVSVFRTGHLGLGTQIPKSISELLICPLSPGDAFLLEAIYVAWVPRLQETNHCHILLYFGESGGIGGSTST